MAVAALAAPLPAQPPDPGTSLIRGLATVFTEGFPAAVPPLRTALEAFRRADGDATGANRWLWLACRIASDLWDERLWDELAGRGVHLAREAGALGILPIAASYRAGVHLHAGEFDAAAALMDESAAITQTTGTAPSAPAGNHWPPARPRQAAHRAALGDRTLIADSAETAFCASTSAATLAGLGLNAGLGWWWADPAAALLIAALALKEGIEAWQDDD